MAVSALYDCRDDALRQRIYDLIVHPGSLSLPGNDALVFHDSKLL
jgi:hypothetical protein